VRLAASSALPKWSAFISSLADKGEALAEQLRLRRGELWSLICMPGAAPVSRGFLRDLAELAHMAPPSPATCEVLCAGFCEDGGAILSDDSCLIAAVIAFAANCGCIPSDNSLTNFLAHQPFEMRARVGGRFESWTGSVHADNLARWLVFLNVPADELLREEDEVPPLQPSANVALGQASPQPLVTADSAPAAPPPPAPKVGLRELLGDMPPEFCCPLDGRLLVDPVCSHSGHIFERANLQRFLKMNDGHCPMGLPQRLEDCQRDATLRIQILRWVRSNRARQLPQAA